MYVVSRFAALVRTRAIFEELQRTLGNIRLKSERTLLDKPADVEI